MQRRAKGALVEAAALAHLTRAGLREVATNAHFRFGELDLVLLDASGICFSRKVPSTPANPAEAVIAGIELILSDAKLNPADVSEVLHGTTVGSNTLLQKVGARTGLLTTKGFRDVLEIGRIRTPDMFDLTWDKPQPLVRREDGGGLR